LEKALPAIFPQRVLTHAFQRRFTPPTLRLAIDSYWRAHPVRADRLAGAVAFRGRCADAPKKPAGAFLAPPAAPIAAKGKGLSAAVYGAAPAGSCSPSRARARRRLKRITSSVILFPSASVPAQRHCTSRGTARRRRRAARCGVLAGLRRQRC